MNEKYMRIAIEEAKKAYKNNEIPIGAVIVKDDKIIAKAYNKKNRYNNSLSHAELNAIKKATFKLNNWRLNDCDIYITLEPCPMCASAIKQSRIKKVYYGSSNKDSNNFKIINDIFLINDINGIVDYEKGILEEDCTMLLTNFFKQKRQ